MEAKIKEFLQIVSGSGSGYGSGSGSGDGDGSGDGYGSGDGDGSGDGYGYGSGSGSGDGSGSGYGSGSGSGDGSGSGYGYGDGSGLVCFNGMNVYNIDSIATIITSVKGNVAKGFILHNDLTLEKCYIVKQNNLFAHGATIKEAIFALEGKLFKDMPREERIAKFIESHPVKENKYPAKDLFDWHYRLTGSCEMGRKSFCQDHGIDIESSTFTIDEFISLTKESYNGGVIQKLEQEYKKL